MMADAVTVPRRHRWLRKAGWVGLALALLLIILYFAATSSAFFKGVILPKLSKSLNATVTVADASIHPFSGVDMRQVKIQTTGTEPLLTADEIRITYHLGGILSGNYHVEEVTIVSPTVEIVTNPDGSSNLNTLLKKSQPSPGQTAQSQPAWPSKPRTIDINKLALNNATVRMIKEYPGGGRDLSVVTNVNITLEAKLQFDSALHIQIATVRQCLIALTPTSRAANQLNLTGQVDMTRTNFIQGALRLEAESLDFTPYYDLLSGKSAAAKRGRTAPPSTSALSTEPAPINPPLRNFRVDANVGSLFVHEVAITNFQTTVNIDGSHVLVKPFQLTLNGAPVNATVHLDLGVPGYHYDLTLAAANIPVEPLANSFSPTYKGAAKGDLSANAQIKGSGITGTSLQKNLTGQFNIVFTNADIKLVGKKARRIIVPIATALRLSELTKSTINLMMVDASITNGNIHLTQFKAVGSEFSARSQGTITIANVLTNSPVNNLPVDFSLPTLLAKKAHLAPSNMNTNAAYVDLGKIATVAGTVGNPKTKIDYAAISLLTLKSIVGIPGAVGKESGQILKGVEGFGGILGGKSSSSTNQPSTTSTNPPAGNPIDFLHKVIPK
jgi:uncharacterized protein involved in outer membrane biogenesis